MMTLEEFWENAGPKVTIGCGCSLYLILFIAQYCVLIGTLERSFTEAAAGFLVLAVSGGISRGEKWIGRCGVDWGRQIWTAIRRKPQKDESHASNLMSIRLAALGAQVGAFLLPGLVFPDLMFHGEVKIRYFVVILPSLQICAITLISIGGAFLGATGVGTAIEWAENLSPAQSETEPAEFPQLTKIFDCEFLFQLLHKGPQVFLAFMLAMEGTYNLEDRWNGGIFVLLTGLFYFAIPPNPGIELFLMLSSRRRPQFLHVYSGIGWIGGGFLMWWLCRGSATVQAIVDHKIPYTRWLEPKFFLAWGLEGLVGACCLSFLAASFGAWSEEREELARNR